MQIPFEDAIAYNERIAKSDLVLVDDAGHTFKKQAHADTLIRHTVHFLTSGTILDTAKS